MNDTSPQSNSHIVDEIFARLSQSDIEQFYAGYQRWYLQQQIATLQTQIDALQLQILENTEHLQEVHPSAISLATLARLQAHGVSDIDLLDRMLERGESWLDQTMQRLDYCEQLDDFIRDDYTQWCNLALEGAYDWIDSIQEPTASSPAQEPIAVEEEVIETTKELLLQKLSSDEVEDEASTSGTTLKQPAVTPSSSEEPASTSADEDRPVAVEIPSTSSDERAGIPSSDNAEAGMQEDASPQESLSVENTAVSGTEQPAAQEYPVPASEIEVPASESTEPPPQEDTTLEEPLSAESSSISAREQPAINEQSALQESVEVAPATEEPYATSSPEPPAQIEEPAPSEASPLESEKHEANIRVSVPQAGAQPPQNTVVEKRPNFIIRLLKSIWG
jgi:hypothetical protein